MKTLTDDELATHALTRPFCQYTLIERTRRAIAAIAKLEAAAPTADMLRRWSELHDALYKVRVDEELAPLRDELDRKLWPLLQAARQASA